ncbi:MAG: excinuclease ABC subunit A [Limisphaerales bacterium]|nr:MAG: excinuclease ABC subunit A [Limisphaerales bacterium]KAG0510095.1 MAG: excinuclease ABC subunit A [Limisphaerales bacterium]TXT52938.1 MAG: excinuclease ABC subunit A [Limisphaerales bacterium]
MNLEPETLNEPNEISIHGARHHNLKNLSLAIPRGKFVVVTGVSGSGKSTLAFDLIFAEGQRRFLDAMNAYARQFVEQMARPDVDLITGIPPTVSIEQRNSRGGGKSTVATVTEIHHFLRLLFAKLGTQFCPQCNVPVTGQTRDALAANLQNELKQRGDLLLLAPVVKNRKGFHSEVATWAAKNGYAEIRADGRMFRTDEHFRLDRFKEHDVEIVVGVLEKRRSAGVPARSASERKQGLRISEVSPASEAAAGGDARAPQQLVDIALKLGHGTLYALDNHRQLTVHSTERACPTCHASFAALDPKNFSYNSAQGWCPQCRGFGELFYIPDVERGANADSVEESWWSWAQEREVCPECHGARLNPVARAVRLVVAADVRRLTSTSALAGRKKKSEPPHVGCYADGVTIDFFSTANVDAALAYFSALKLAGRDADIARDILPEIRERLKFLSEVGLGYLQLGRAAPTLSGGEAQRMRLAAQLGSNLSGVLYVLDEPTIGLHARDNALLLGALKQLQSRGNSLLVVEHDEDTMRHADWVIDLGPGAGVKGGEVIASGTLKELLRHKESITGQQLRAQEGKKYPSRGERRAVAGRNGAGEKVGRRESEKQAGRGRATGSLSHSHTFPPAHCLTLANASTHNLKDLTVRFPLNRFVVITGVSGSGKSTLIRECLLPAVQTALAKPSNARRSAPDARRQTSSAPRLAGHESLSAVYEVDQSPIGRTPRSTPATYVGFFDDIRALFAQVPEARMRGYGPGRFSFNSPAGRCPGCDGAGEVKLEMNFLPPAYVRCEVCNGLRFNPETLDVLFNGKNIAQVLDLSVAEALEFFAAQKRIRRPLEALRDTGLDYLKLGQTSPTLSGGEAQRVKLVTHLLGGLKDASADKLPDPRFQTRNAKLFILEEPTIGLHMSDVQRLVAVLQRLVDAGHSVIVIEHNLDLIAEADWVIDLGPEAGDAGGGLVAEGTPEEVARCERSHTGRFLSGLVGR